MSNSDLLGHRFISRHGFCADYGLYAICSSEEIDGHLAPDIICPSHACTHLLITSAKELIKFSCRESKFCLLMVKALD